ncbi:MFS transporter [Methanosarcina sp.]|uniref:MFS transporter n=1 Tax=Methanosarcina sp. TaxID=2213 RepID=UPI002988EF32|nr:MFS transporter [Methanosarcina sp.]MDW5548973.1 MFS transporter [Methanosarcina sp.]MDW5552676.1 MFS transporter [Methanosarcina sp.]MDW5559232.1 MFS transporter [Methanosarcina sp.]
MFSLKVPSILHNRSLVILLAARVSTSIAFQMLTIAVGWQIYSITQKPIYLGLVGLVQFLPMLLFTLIVGYVTDRYDRKLIICFSQIVESIGIFLLAYESHIGSITEEGILVTIFFISTANAFQSPPMQSLLPNVVSKEVFPEVAALSASTSQFAFIIGPAIGGILYALSPQVAYSVAGVLTLVTSVIILFVSIIEKSQNSQQVTTNSIFGGIAYIRSKPAILGAISLDLFAVLFGGATALLPVYASDILKIGPLGLGMLRSAPAIGALITSAFLAKQPLKKNEGLKMFAAVMLFGVFTIIFAVSNSFLLSLVSLVLLGASDVISVVVRLTLIQLRTPDNMRGRVNAVNSMFIGTSNQLGEFESGLTASLFGVVPAVLLGGIGSIIIAILWMKLFPELLHATQLGRSTDQ